MPLTVCQKPDRRRRDRGVRLKVPVQTKSDARAPRRLLPFAVAIGATAAAALVNAALWRDLGARFPLIAFFPAIAFSSWLGGFRPGALATMLAAVTAGYLWFASPYFSGLPQQGGAVILGVFVGIGLMISSLYETLRRRTLQAEEAERAAVRLAEELRVSSQRVLEAEQAARQQAEHANRVKNAFLATVSHELRTPLSAILGWTDILKHKLVNDERREQALHAIYRNAQQQAHLLGELLDTARIDSGTFRLNRDRSDLAAIVHDAWATVEPAAEAKCIHGRIDIDSAVPAMPFYADAARLEQVMTNLFANAVKFTPTGGSVRADVCLDDGGFEVRVSDTGRGISREFLPFVFEPFRQAAELPAGQDGFGLGLSIAKHLVEAHGGRIEAASDGPDRGACFTVRLPLTPTVVRTDERSLIGA
jgi:signal transduction histidine kinase